ncbi:MAG TPA: dipeptidase [Blastocatellia bacterium]|nr:dipeptidase [Blastocatellia bacterium]
MKRLCTALIACLVLSGLGASSHAQKGDQLAERARKIHFSSIVLDTHIDTTPRLQTDWKFTEEHTTGHVDLPRMKKGGLNALFFSIYMPGTVTGPKAVNDSIERIAAVHKLAEDMPNQIALCVTADQVRRAHKQGKIAALMGMEGGHMINNSLAVLRMYAVLGVRYLTLTHSVNTDWADSSGDQPKHGGLTDFGKDVVRELNRLGVIVDISHVSDKTFWDVMEVSRAPVIASHSSCRALSGHSRNMTDEMIKAMAKRGGVIQINYLDQFIDNDLYEYWQKAQPLMRQLMEKYPGRENAQKRREEAIKEFGPPPKASWERIVDHIDHAVRLVGTNHVGLGSDFDGGSMPVGMEDVTHLPKITEALLRKGYTETDIRKILGENTLRLMSEVERVSQQLKTGRSASQPAPGK